MFYVTNPQGELRSVLRNIEDAIACGCALGPGSKLYADHGRKTLLGRIDHFTASMLFQMETGHSGPPAIVCGPNRKNGGMFFKRAK